jgi:hypothetical protein
MASPTFRGTPFRIIPGSNDRAIIGDFPWHPVAPQVWAMEQTQQYKKSDAITQFASTLKTTLQPSRLIPRAAASRA